MPHPILYTTLSRAYIGPIYEPPWFRKCGLHSYREAQYQECTKYQEYQQVVRSLIQLPGTCVYRAQYHVLPLGIVLPW